MLCLMAIAVPTLGYGVYSLSSAQYNISTELSYTPHIHEVTYMLNGGSVNGSTDNFVEDYDIHSDYTLITQGTESKQLSKTNSVLIGWSENLLELSQDFISSDSNYSSSDNNFSVAYSSDNQTASFLWQIPVNAGYTYSFSWAKESGAFRPVIQFYDQENQNISSSLNISNFTYDSVSNGQYYTTDSTVGYNFVMPENVKYIKIAFAKLNNCGEGNVNTVSDLSFYQGVVKPVGFIRSIPAGSTTGNKTYRAQYKQAPAYLYKSWTYKLEKTHGIDVSTILEIEFTKDSSKYEGMAGPYTIGASSSTGTTAYSTTFDVVDVSAYWDATNKKLVVYSPVTIYAPVESDYLFSNSSSIYHLPSMTTLTLNNLDTSNVTNMSFMFYYCYALTTLDLSNFDTSNVTSMYEMFYDCVVLTTLNLSSFDTSNVTNMSSMFYACEDLTTLDLSSFNTSKVTNMSSMFYYCYALTTLDISNFDTSNVTDMLYMFYRCSRLTTLNLSSFDTSNVTDMESMFRLCESLTTLNVGNFDTSNVTDVSSMFSNCAALTSLDLSSFNTSNVTDMSKMFYNCQKLTTLDLSSFNTSNVTSMYQMFYECQKLTALDLSSFNTSNVTTMEEMFRGCSALTTLDVSSLDTSNVTNMSYMFNYCSDLTTLDVGSFDTSNVTDMSSMFYGCFALTTLDLSSFNTSNVTTMYNMFQQCYDLTTLDLSSFNTSNVTNMSLMFSYCRALTTLDLSSFNTLNVTNMSYMFRYCEKLTTLDLSSFNTSNVITMEEMFDDCLKLTTLDLSSFNTSNVTNMQSMFSRCFSLTTLDIGGSFVINNGTSVRWMFSSCDPETIYLPSTIGSEIQVELDTAYYDQSTGERVYSTGTTNGFNTAHAGKVIATTVPVFKSYLLSSWRNKLDEDYNIDIRYTATEIEFTNDSSKYAGMAGPYSIGATGFDGATSFAINTPAVVDVSAYWDSTNNKLVIYSPETIYAPVSCDNLFAALEADSMTIKFNNFDTSNVTSMKNMFGNSHVTSLDLSTFNTENVEDMSDMFVACDKLTTLNLSTFNTSKVTNMTEMFEDCKLLETLYLNGTFAINNGTTATYMFGNEEGVRISPITIYLPTTIGSEIEIELNSAYYDQETGDQILLSNGTSNGFNSTHAGKTITTVQSTSASAVDKPKNLENINFDDNNMTYDVLKKEETLIEVLPTAVVYDNKKSY